MTQKELELELLVPKVEELVLELLESKSITLDLLSNDPELEEELKEVLS